MSVFDLTYINNIKFADQSNFNACFYPNLTHIITFNSAQKAKKHYHK